jgi:hypothetical protein
MEEYQKYNVPTLKEAKLLLKEAENLFPGLWVQHSIYAAEAAKLIAENCDGMDSEIAYILGLLHDLGRRDSNKYGITTMGHILCGYNYSKELGYDLLAKICMTHSCPTKSIFDIDDIVNKNCTEEEYEFVENYFNKIEYNDYDKLIQLCDALALHNGFTLIEKRLIDVALRHGVNEYTVSKWKAFMELKNYFEEKMGKSVYGILPGVVENTFDL